MIRRELEEIISSEVTLKTYLETSLLDRLINRSGLSPVEVAAVANRKRGCSLAFWNRPRYPGNRNIPSETAILLKQRVNKDPPEVLMEELARAYDRIAEDERSMIYRYPKNSPQVSYLERKMGENQTQAWQLRSIAERYKERKVS